MEELKAAADLTIVKHRENWEKERLRLDKLLNSKETLPNNYWVEEHRARLLLMGAIEFRELLE